MKKKLHKTILTLAMVLIPPYFLMFTDEGMRVTDNVVLWVMGGDSIEFNMKEADAAFTSKEIIKIFPDLPWECNSQKSSFGTHTCTTPIASYNEYPAERFSSFFVNDHLNAVKVVYRPQYHAQILGTLIKELGQPRNVAEAIRDTPDAAQVLEWDTGKGLVILKKELNTNDEPAMLWLASR